MARRELVSATVLRPGAQQGVAIVGAFALIVAVIVGVNLWIGDEQLPREIRGSTPWFGAVALALGGLTAGLWMRSRRRLTLVDQDGQQVLEIDDRPPVLLSGPFTVRTGWTRLSVARGVSTILVQVVFVEGERVPLVLTEEWGALMTPPPWPEGLVAVAGADAAYASGGIRFLKQLVDTLERRDPGAPGSIQ
jgi:hypothetical protein